MTSSALKGQRVATRRAKTANVGKLLDAANELRTAIETIGHYDRTEFLAALAKTGGDGDLAGLFNASTEYAAGRLMTATDEAVELLAEITNGVEPTEGNMTGGARDQAWAKLRQALTIKNWPVNAIDEVIDVATDMVNDGCYAEVFGYSNAPAAAPLPAALGRWAVANANAAPPVLCHGCPDEQVAGVEADPRGFLGLLCADCADKARRDVATGNADLGPLASDEAKAKADEVQKAYDAKQKGEAVPS